MARISIDDCLDVLDNRFALVTIAATRTRQLMSGDEPLLKTKNKFAVTALREIAEGLILAQIPAELGEVTRAKLKPEAKPLTNLPSAD